MSGRPGSTPWPSGPACWCVAVPRPSRGRRPGPRPSSASTPRRNPADAYWGRGGYFGAGAPERDSSLPRIDALFVGDEEDLALPGAFPAVHLDYRLRPQTVGLDDLGQLRADLAAFETAVNGAEAQLVTALRAVLDDVDGEASALGRTVPIVAVPLVLISWFVVMLLVAALTEERGPEVALAKLRGYSPGAAARFGRGEAFVLVGVAVPVGTLAALAVVEGARLGEGVHVELRWPVAVAALIAAVAGFAAVRLASAATLARPVLSLLRRVPERTTWRAGVGEGLVVALAAASLVAAVSDRTAPLALLAPALIAVVAAIVTARLLALWSRVRVRRNLRTGRVVGILAHAQLSRRPLGHRVAIVVTVAVALLSFAATAWDVAAQARRDVAIDTVGADRVLLVAAGDPTALSAAVAAAAPDGDAMAVVRATEHYDTGVVEIVGVEAQRLAAVAVWRGQETSAVARLADSLRDGVRGTGAQGGELPVVLAGDTPADDPAGDEFTFPGLGDSTSEFTVVDRVARLPRVSGRAFLVDLDRAVAAAQRGAGLSDNTRLRYEVWAGASAPADLVDRLAAAGVPTLAVQTIEGERDRLSRAAPALGLRLYLIAGVVAVALAVGAVLLTAYVGAAARRYELAALRVAGVRPRVLRRGLRREYAHLLGVPFAAGLLVGVAGATLMLPGIPLVTVGTALGEITYQPGLGVLPIAVAATVVGLLLALAVVLGLVRQAAPQRLREGGV